VHEVGNLIYVANVTNFSYGLGADIRSKTFELGLSIIIFLICRERVIIALHENNYV
jgi:hypothetical protein